MSSSSVPPPLFNMQSLLKKVYMHIDYQITSSDGKFLELKKSTLIDFVSAIPKLVSLSVPGEPNMEFLNVLSKETRTLIIALLQILKDLFDNDLCLKSLDANDINVLLDYQCTPKLKETVMFVQSSEKLIDLNMLQLGQLLKDTIFNGCDLPLVVKDFLNLFMVNGSANRELIFVHPVIVDLDDQNDYFCHVHDFLLKIIKKLPKSPSDCNDILKELVFPGDWDPNVIRNPYLRDCYEGRDLGRGSKKKGKCSKATTGGIGQSVGIGKGAVESGEPSGSAGSGIGALKSVGAGKGALESGEPSGSVIGAGRQAVKMTQPSNKRGSLQPVNKGGSGQSLVSGTRAPYGKLVKKGTPMKSDHSDSLKRSKQTVNRGAPTMLVRQEWIPKVQRTEVLEQAPDEAKLTQAKPSATSTSIPAQASPNGPAASSSSIDGKQTYNRPGSKPEKEVLKYYRNSAQHGLDYAVDDGCLRYGPRGLAIMLVFHFPLLLSSALKALHKRGYLSSMENLPRLLR